jgi:hypothetical protein
MPPALALMLVFGLFAALACGLTYPLVRFDQPVLPNVDDAYFNVWRLAWVAHQVGRDPLSLFDTNVFFPEQNTLAYSDAMLALGLMAAPAINLGMHPVIAHNLLLVAAFATSAWSAFLLCRHLTGSTSASLIGGLIFGFAPYRFAHIGHLELLWTAPMPLALLILHVDSDHPARKGLLLGAVLALQAYCSLYYAAFLAIFIGAWTLLALALVSAPERRRLARCLVVGGITALLLTAPYGYVYYNAHRELGARRVEEVRRYSARPTDYLQANSENKTYRPGPAEVPEERSLFPGITAVALGLYALVARRDRLAAMYGVLVALAFDLSLGLNGLAYPIVASVVPFLHSLRAPARFAALVLVSLSVLAAFGVHALVSPLSPRARNAVVMALAAVCLIEYWSAPLGTRAPALTRPAVYQWLRSHNDSIVVELPMPTPGTLWLYETTYQYMSIFHWSRLVNGYSGYAPRSYIRTLQRMEDFPSERAIARLQELGVHYVIVHERGYQPLEFVALVEAMMQSPAFDKPLTLPDPVDPAYVFALRPAPPH